MGFLLCETNKQSIQKNTKKTWFQHWYAQFSHFRLKLIKELRSRINIKSILVWIAVNSGEVLMHCSEFNCSKPISFSLYSWFCFRINYDILYITVKFQNSWDSFILLPFSESFYSMRHPRWPTFSWPLKTNETACFGAWNLDVMRIGYVTKINVLRRFWFKKKFN